MVEGNFVQDVNKQARLIRGLSCGTQLAYTAYATDINSPTYDIIVVGVRSNKYLFWFKLISIYENTLQQMLKSLYHLRVVLSQQLTQWQPAPASPLLLASIVVFGQRVGTG